MKCPKCDHEQQGEEVCESCGIYFAKYQKFLDANKPVEIEAVSAELSSPGKSSRTRLSPMLVLVLTIGISGGVFFWLGQGSVAPKSSSQEEVILKAESSGVASLETDGLNLSAQLLRNAAPGNVIEQARNATVFIKTTFGTGSGFFISSDCTIITNKHVIQLDPNDLTKIEKRLAHLRDYTDSYRINLERRKEQYKKMCSKRVCTDEFRDSYIGRFERRLKKMEESLAQSDDRMLTASQEKDYIIVLADGTEFDATLEYVSENHDLATLSLWEKAHCPTLTPTSPGRLSQGNQLFTIGSPVGIQHVVTSGIFSGFVKVKDKKMLQTDAPINPGNSGGPLINKAGNVVGINTLVLTKAQGIGFAIPIDTALQELRLPVSIPGNQSGL